MSKEKAKSDSIARQREYYLKHRDKMLAYSRKYIKDHPEKPVTCTFEDKEFDDTLGDYDNE